MAAVAQLVFGNIDANHAVLTTDFVSVEIETNGTYTFTTANKQYLIVNALVDIYVSFTSNGSAPNPSVAPRVKVLAGTFFPFSIRSGVKVGVVAA